jgi:hypothetical protein
MPSRADPAGRSTGPTTDVPGHPVAVHVAGEDYGVADVGFNPALGAAAARGGVTVPSVHADVLDLDAACLSLPVKKTSVGRQMDVAA